MSIYKNLTLIQNELKVPKNQYNAFGKYKYRNCEDVLEAIKPLLQKYNCSLHMSDTLENIGERYYIKATATLISNIEEVVIQVSAYAREEETKKGMDGSQITGTASSYARKYALNGLFAIDDTKDSDTTNTHGKENIKPATDTVINLRTKVVQLLKDTGMSTEEIRKILKGKYNVENTKYLTKEQCLEIIGKFKGVEIE